MSFTSSENQNRYGRMSKAALRAASVTLAAAMIFGAAGCSKPKDPAGRGIDLSKYVTLGTYSGIEVTEVSSDYSDEELSKEVKDLLDYYAMYGYLSEGDYYQFPEADHDKVQEGDTVLIDYAGYKDGVAFQGGTAEDQYLTIGSHRFIDGFEDGLIGAKRGEERDLNLTFPENYGNADLAGAEVVFKVTVKGICEKKFELTDEMTQKVFSSTVDELRTKATEARAEEAKNTMRTDAMTKILEQSTVSGYPEEIWQDYYDYNYNGVEKNAEKSGKDISSYLQSARGQTLDEFKDDCKEYANHQTEYYLVLMAVCEQENITLTKEEYESYVAEQIEEASISREEYFNIIKDVEVKEDILCEKAIDWIMDHAVLVAPEED
ncbi:MAG: trigger factor [Lachnospiraceae bacterium]|nr:trigger factor [Lachnospiraceae bacterium]